MAPYGARVLLLVGAGDNGGDTLYAGARLARRGAGWMQSCSAVTVRTGRVSRRFATLAVAWPTRTPARSVRSPNEPISPSTASSGIGGTPGLRPAAEKAVAAIAAAGVPVIAVDLPSGIGVDNGETLQATSTPTSPSRSVPTSSGLLIDPGADAAGPVRLVDIGLAPYLTEPPDVEALEADDVRALLPQPGRKATSTAAASSAWTPVPPRTPGAAVLAVGAAARGGAGMVRYHGSDEVAEHVRQRWPEPSSERAKCRPGRSGRGCLRTTMARGASGRCSTLASPSSSTPAGWSSYTALCRCRRCSRRTRASWPGCLVSSGTRCRLGGSSTHGAPPPSCRRPCCSRGQPHSSSSRTDGPGSTAPVRQRSRPPAPAMCWPAWPAPCSPAGLIPLDAGSVAAYLHGVAASIARREAGSPTASDLLDAVPRAILGAPRLTESRPWPTPPVAHAEVRVDLTAIRDNVAALAARAPTAQVMAVVKADGYGHGLVPSARAALAGGATWLGTAVLPEALMLRGPGSAAGSSPGSPARERWADAIAADIDVTASSVADGRRDRGRGGRRRPPGARCTSRSTPG